MRPHSRIFVAGHRGLLGSALVRRLEADGYSNLLLRSRQQLDLRDRAAVDRFFKEEEPEYVFLAAARVGGILANAQRPAEFLRDNLAIELNVIDAAYRCGVQKLLFFGSSCIYPKFASQPIREDSLLTGALEPTNDAYAVAKIAGVYLCQSYRKQYGFSTIAAMPANLYGPCDNFDPESSHVIPGLMRKFHDAVTERKSSVTLWGTGSPRREFLHADDCASAAIFLMNHYDGGEIVNVGSGEDLPISELAQLIARVTGFTGEVKYDHSKPDGTPRKLLDVTRLNALGWRPSIPLVDGLRETYQWFVRNLVEAR